MRQGAQLKGLEQCENKVRQVRAEKDRHPSRLPVKGTRGYCGKDARQRGASRTSRTGAWSVPSPTILRKKGQHAWGGKRKKKKRSEEREMNKRSRNRRREAQTPPKPANFQEGSQPPYLCSLPLLSSVPLAFVSCPPSELRENFLLGRTAI